MTSLTIHNKHPVLAFSLLSLILTILFFHRAFFFGEGYSGASNLYNDSLYRSSMPKNWAFATMWDESIYWQMLPWDLYAARSIRKGEIPLWNPYSGAGGPFVANWQSAVFSPLKIPFYLFPSPKMFDILLIAKVWLASLCTFLFCRERKTGFLPSACASLSYGFGGSTISCLRLFELNTLILSPLFFLAIHRICRRPTIHTAAWGSLACGLLILSGHPEATTYTFLGGVMYAVFSGTNRLRTSVTRKKYAYWGLAFFGGAMISSAALIPFFEFLTVGFTYRMHISGETGPFWGLLVRLGSLLLPVPLSEFPDAYFLYIGILPLAFSLHSLRNAGAYLPLFAVLLLGAGFVVSLPPLSLLGYLPGLHHFSSRYAIGLVTFPLSVLAGEGMSVWIKTAKERGPGLRTMGTALLLVLCMIGLALVFLAREVRPWLAAIETHFVLAVIFTCAILLVGSVRKTISQYIVIPLLMADLFLAGFRFNSPGPLFDFPGTAAVRFLTGLQGVHRVLGMEGSNDIPNTGLVHRIQDTRVIDPMFLRRYVGFIQIIDPHAFFQIGAIPRRVLSPLWDLLNIKYVIRCRCMVSGTENLAAGVTYTPAPYPLRWHFAPSPPADHFTRVYSDEFVEIYKNKRALPRAFIVHDVVFSGSENESYFLLRDKHFDPRRQALLEVPGPREREEITTILKPITPGASTAAEIISYAPARVMIKASLPSAGVLVLSDAYYPGWKVLVDGHEGRIYPADYLLRGVPLPVGDHVLEFTYEPRSFKVGAALSLLSLLSAASVIIYPWNILCRTKILRSRKRQP